MQVNNAFFLRSETDIKSIKHMKKGDR